MSRGKTSERTIPFNISIDEGCLLAKIVKDEIKERTVRSILTDNQENPMEKAFQEILTGFLGRINENKEIQAALDVHMTEIDPLIDRYRDAPPGSDEELERLACLQAAIEVHVDQIPVGYALLERLKNEREPLLKRYRRK